MNKYIDATSEYANENNGDDFVRDDEVVPIGYQDDSNYFGLQETPDIDEFIDSENERTQSDSYDKYVGAEIILPNSADQSLMARVKKKISSNDTTIQIIIIRSETTADMKYNSQTVQLRRWKPT